MRARAVIYKGIEYPSIIDAAAAIGVSFTTVRTGLHRGHLLGEQIRHKDPLKPVKKITISLSFEHSDWVARNMPEGASPPEFVAAILNDAMAEETA